MEDYELLRMLAQHDPAQARELVAEVVRSATDYETDPAALEQVRRKVIHALGTSM